MLSRRFIKKSSYAFGGALLLIVLIIFLYTANSRSNQPIPITTDLPNHHEDLQVESVNMIQHGNVVDVIARLRNPNPRAGVASLPVKFVMLNDVGQELAVNEKKSYILPGNIQYVISVGIKVAGKVDTIKVELPDKVVFTDIPGALELPVFNSFAYNRTFKQVGDTTMEEQRGVITNNSTFDFNKVEVAAIGFDRNGEIVGVGTTFLGALLVNEQREFTIQWFKPENQTERVIIFPTTNIFQEENIIRVIGDPGLL